MSSETISERGRRNDAGVRVPTAVELKPMLRGSHSFPNLNLNPNPTRLSALEIKIKSKSTIKIKKHQRGLHSTPVSTSGPKWPRSSRPQQFSLWPRLETLSAHFVEKSNLSQNRSTKCLDKVADEDTRTAIMRTAVSTLAGRAPTVR